MIISRGGINGANKFLDHWIIQLNERRGAVRCLSHEAIVDGNSKWNEFFFFVGRICVISVSDRIFDWCVCQCQCMWWFNYPWSLSFTVWRWWCHRNRTTKMTLFNFAGFFSLFLLFFVGWLACYCCLPLSIAWPLLNVSHWQRDTLYPYGSHRIN